MYNKYSIKISNDMIALRNAVMVFCQYMYSSCRNPGKENIFRTIIHRATRRENCEKYILA
jgi:hypothetical protein